MANKRTVGRVLAKKVPLHKSRSDCLHTITAVIVVKGTIVSIGHNRKLRPSVYNQHTIHAEIDALNTVKPGTDLSKAEIYVSRFNPKGKPLLAEPCKKCKDAIERAGIQRVYYTVQSNELNWQVL
jgi:deoxycytidylate deaminase